MEFWKFLRQLDSDCDFAVDLNPEREYITTHFDKFYAIFSWEDEMREVRLTPT